MQFSKRYFAEIPRQDFRKILLRFQDTLLFKQFRENLVDYLFRGTIFFPPLFPLK